MPRAGLLLLAVPGVEDGLSGLASDTAGNVEIIQVELGWCFPAQDNEAEELALNRDRRKQKRRRLETEARAGLEGFLPVNVVDQLVLWILQGRREETLAVGDGLALISRQSEVRLSAKFEALRELGSKHDQTNVQVRPFILEQHAEQFGKGK